MGNDATAILFWGFPVESDEGFDYDWEDKLAASRGIKEPESEYSASTKAAHQAFWEKRDQIAKAEPCAIDRHSSGDDPMPFVAVKESVIRAEWGDPQRVPQRAAPPQWENELRSFCAVMKIEWQTPGWFVAAYYG